MKYKVHMIKIATLAMWVGKVELYLNPITRIPDVTLRIRYDEVGNNFTFSANVDDNKYKYENLHYKNYITFSEEELFQESLVVEMSSRYKLLFDDLVQFQIDAIDGIEKFRKAQNKNFYCHIEIGDI